MTDTNDIIACWQCGNAVKTSWRVCPHCHALIYREQLQKLADTASSLEASDIPRAIETWKQVLDLLPPDAVQAQQLRAHVEELSRRGVFSTIPYASGDRRAEAPKDNWMTILLKTGGSALFSVWLLHSMSEDWYFAIGMVVMILIHECGHWAANIYYGIKASPPIFLGPLGAVIWLREPLPSAKIESIMGIAGPVFGSVAAMGAFVYWKISHNVMFAELAYFGFLINLFNLIPLPPLDGGRTVAAVSPKVWPAGIAALIGFAVYRYLHGGLGDFTVFILIYILMSAWPRVSITLKNLPRMGDYYKTSMTFKIAIALLHAGLAVGLYVMMQVLPRPGFY